SWNFLTDEDTPATFNDLSFWSLVNINSGELLANTAFPTFVPGNPTVFDEQTGFQNVSYTFTASGTFILGFGVIDVNDGSVDSGLLIDNVSITPAEVPVPASLVLWGMGGGLAFL